jgi:hypothetical protein
MLPYVALAVSVIAFLASVVSGSLVLIAAARLHVEIEAVDARLRRLEATC